MKDGWSFMNHTRTKVVLCPPLRNLSMEYRAPTPLILNFESLRSAGKLYADDNSAENSAVSPLQDNWTHDRDFD